MLQLLGILALEEANTLLTPRPPAEGYNPKVTEGMCFALHPMFFLLGNIYLEVFLLGTVYLMVDPAARIAALQNLQSMKFTCGFHCPKCLKDVFMDCTFGSVCHRKFTYTELVGT